MGCAVFVGHATSASRCSKLPSSTKSGWPRQNEKKPSEVSSDKCPGEGWSRGGEATGAETCGEGGRELCRCVGEERSWQRAQSLQTEARVAE